MATYDNLPVYKKTYDVLIQLFRISQNMERDYKFTIGENLKKEVIELIMNVYRANCRTEKPNFYLIFKQNYLSSNRLHNTSQPNYLIKIFLNFHQQIIKNKVIRFGDNV